MLPTPAQAWGGGGRRNHAINKEEARRDREKGGRRECMYIHVHTVQHTCTHVHVHAYTCTCMCMCVWLIVASTNCGIVF